MASKTENVDLHPFHIYRDRARSLRGVYDKQQPSSPRQRSDPSDVDRIAGQIGGMRADDRPRLGTDQRLKITAVHHPAPVRADNAQRDGPLRLQPEERAQDGVVFKVGSYNMAAVVYEAVYRDIERLRGIAGKDRMVAARASEETGEFSPCIVDGARRLKSPACVPREALPINVIALTTASVTRGGFCIVVAALSR